MVAGIFGWACSINSEVSPVYFTEQMVIFGLEWEKSVTSYLALQSA